jgi:hypothetical protein
VVAVTADSVQNIVEQLAARPDAHPFGASYIAQRTGIDVADAYKQLEALAERHDLERHFELISPTTGRSLEEYRLGDTVPVGDTYEPESEEEEPFVVTPEDILISFSPTAKLQARARDTQKKKQSTQIEPPSPELQQLQAQLQATLIAVQRAMREIASKIRSEALRRFTSSTTGR